MEFMGRATPWVSRVTYWFVELGGLKKIVLNRQKTAIFSHIIETAGSMQGMRCIDKFY